MSFLRCKPCGGTGKVNQRSPLTYGGVRVEQVRCTKCGGTGRTR